MAKKFKTLSDKLLSMKKTYPLKGKQQPKQKVYIVIGFGPGDITHVIKVYSNFIFALWHSAGLNGKADEGISYTVIRKSVEGTTIKSADASSKMYEAMQRMRKVVKLNSLSTNEEE